MFLRPALLLRLPRPPPPQPRRRHRPCPHHRRRRPGPRPRPARPHPASPHPRHRHRTRPGTRQPARISQSASHAAAAAGQDLSWTDFHGIQLPVSPAAGPRHTTGGLASGFTDTPDGALLAAINIGVRTAAQWGPAIFTPTITRQVTGPDTAALLRADTTAYAALRAAAHVRARASPPAAATPPRSPTGSTPGPRPPRPSTSSAPGRAATAPPCWPSPASRCSGCDGDWRVLAPPGGNWANAAVAVSSLTGYTIFPGER